LNTLGEYKRNLTLSLQKLNSTDDQYLKELDARVDAQREQVKVALQSAIEGQDASKIMEANDRLTQLAVEKEKARLEMINREERKKADEEKSKQQQYVQAEPQTAESSQPAATKLHLKPKNGPKRISGLGMMRS
jgi:hypothetical protein